MRLLWSTILAVAGIRYACCVLVSLNPYCPLYDDLEHMNHDPVLRTVKVLYKPARRCREPSLIVRLSGAALLILKNEGLRNNTQVFSYQPLLDDGEYFLEAVVIFCFRYDPDEISKQCVENAHFGRNVLHQPYSFRAIKSAHIPAAVLRPRWVHLNTSMPKLVSTRHQRLISEAPNCARMDQQFCHTGFAELQPYHAYTWMDGQQWQDDAKTVFNQLTAPASSTAVAKTVAAFPTEWVSSTPLINICFVGDSHSRMLYKRRVNETDGITAVSYIFSLFPPLFNITALDAHRCSVAILSYGIWSLYDTPYPHTQTAHRAQMGALIKQLAAYQGPTRIYIRSENINGLGYGTLGCNNNDRRSPPAFDMVNRVTRELCEQYKIPFIDLDPIIYPMWDAAADYCHPPGHVFEAEVSYILHRIFKHTLSNKQVLTTYHVQGQEMNKTSLALAMNVDIISLKMWLKNTRASASQH